MPKEVSAGAVIFRMEHGVPYYLLLHYQSGHWEFAKGHLEKGESDIEAAKREIKEETGIDDIHILPGFKKSLKYFFRASYGLQGEAKKKAPWVFKLVVFYLAKTHTKDIQLSKEHIGFAWLPYQGALARLTFKNAKELLKAAHHRVGLKNDAL